ncbi:MAG TPA: XRE family transcriptional regulator [Myxococcales bacterium]|jgi:Zn-dependent peptidase ImmA (M78 family)/transcriptional regulator with XRE-family HTH domain|nr:XRE family transcriptional regulator [Myxococcales bacterium]
MVASTNLRELGLRLRKRRTEAGLSEEQLATLAELAPVALRTFEEGSGNLGAAHLLRIARVLGVPGAQFLSVQVSETTARPEPAVFLRSLGLADLNDIDAETIAHEIRRAGAFVELGKLLNAPNLSRQFNGHPAPAAKPYLAGYRLAELVRTELASATGGRLQSTGPLRNLQRLTEEIFNILVVSLGFSKDRLQGASARSGPARVVVMSRTLRFESTRRFVLAHELAHHLFDLSENGATLDTEMSGRFLLDNSAEEKRANAFAAMFLMPEGDVRRVLGPPAIISSVETARSVVNQLRTLYGASPEATAWHMLNLRYLADDEMVREVIACSWADVGGFEEEPLLDGLERRAREAIAKGIITTGKARELLDISADTQLPGLE